MNFTIPYPPTSGNHQHGANGAQKFTTPEIRAWRENVAKVMRFEIGQQRFENGRYRVSLLVAAPDARKRDLDNVAKVVLDAISDRKKNGEIVSRGAIDDDCRVDELKLYRIKGMKGSGHIAVEIEAIEDVD